MEIKKVGLIGMGVLGRTHYNWLKSQDKIEKILVYDIKESDIPNDDLGYLVQESDVIFLSLPTPTGVNGSLDISNVEKMLDEINNGVEGETVEIVIRSTMPIGSMNYLAGKYNKLKLYYMPEFLTERFAKDDFENPWIHIWGNTRKDIKETVKMFEAMKVANVFPSAPKELIVDSKIAEAVKLFTNSFYALRIIFANEIYDLCAKQGINYETVKTLLCCDTRIGSDFMDFSGNDVHFRIAQDGKYGFGGKCLPKDLSEVVEMMCEIDAGYGLLQKVEEINNDIREKDVKGIDKKD